MCVLCGLPFETPVPEGTTCGSCLARPPKYDRARAIMRYDDASKGAILAFKHADRLELAPSFARWLARIGEPMLQQADFILPVPLHPGRLWLRRYNQSAELARRLAQMSGKVFAPRLLERIRRTPSQGSMPSASARRRNVGGAFRVPEKHRATLRGRVMILVDDVLTTGATLDACASVLKRAGAEKVLALALARVVRRA